MKPRFKAEIILIFLLLLIVVSIGVVAFFNLFWLPHKAMEQAENVYHELMDSLDDMSQSAAPQTNTGNFTVIPGEEHRLDVLAPVLDDIFGTDGYTLKLEVNKIVTRVTASDAVELAAEIENGGDYTKWPELLEIYISYNEQIALAAAEQDLDFPALLYGMDDAENILFTISGGTVAYSAVKEPPKNTDESVTEMREPTLGEKNALKKAQDYLEVMHFSYARLVKQLEYEGYTNAEAVYGAMNCGADWYDQAYGKAQDYLDTMAFSREGLIRQLEYEGFTNVQAEYAANMVGY